MTRNNPYLAGVMNANQVAQDRAHSADMAAARNAVAEARAAAAHAESIADLSEECTAIVENTLAEMKASRDECHARSLRIAAQRDEYKAQASKKTHIITDLCGQVSDLEDDVTELNKKLSEQVEEIAALKAQLQAKKVFEDIQVEREQRKLKEKEILQLLQLKAAPAPQRKRRPIGIVAE